MGKIDRELWKKGAGVQPGCSCLYCKGSWNWENANPQLADPPFAVHTYQALKDGEIQYLEGEPFTTRRFLGKPGCLAKVATPAPAYRWMIVYDDSGNAVVPPEAKVSCQPTPKTGFNCRNCNFKNDYATANQPDGTYVCFNCR